MCVESDLIFLYSYLLSLNTLNAIYSPILYFIYNVVISYLPILNFST